MEVSLDYLWGENNGVLSLPVLDETKREQRGEYVIHLDAGPETHISEGDISLETLLRVALEELQNDIRPIRTITNLPQVTQRLFRRTSGVLSLGKFEGNRDEKFSVAFPLVWRKRQNTRKVISLQGLFLFREVADYVMFPRGVDLTQRIE